MKAGHPSRGRFWRAFAACGSLVLLLSCSKSDSIRNENQAAAPSATLGFRPADLPTLDVFPGCVANNLRRQAAGGSSLGVAAPEAERLVRQILADLSLNRPIVVLACDQIPQAEANIIPPGVVDPADGRELRAGEYIVYNPVWTRQVMGEDPGQAVALFGHEIGHFLNGDFVAPRNGEARPKIEGDADHFAGCALAKRDLPFAGAESLFKRLRGEQASDYPSAADSTTYARQGYEQCGGNAERVCRIPENGIERWQSVATQVFQSNWRGGGGSQERYCDEAMGEAKRALPQSSLLEVIAKSEETRDDCAPLRCIKYQYSCTIRLSQSPIYNEAKSKNCPAVTRAGKEGTQ